jgi:prephenate dehydrogenase
VAGNGTRFNTVAVLGVGLLGGSLGLGLKARGLAGTVRGVGRNAETLEAARARGAVDEVGFDAREAVADADLVVLCAPVGAILRQLDEIRDACPAGAVVTDVGSTKGAICRHAEETWPKPLRFIGSHPMAGSEKFGPEHATPDLYKGSYTLVTACGQEAPDALEAVRGLWEALGSTVVSLDAQIHDALLARTSHIPHIVAACLAELASNAGDVRMLVGGGFRDMTRIAEGRPELWRDICLTNRHAIAEGLLRLIEQLEDVRRMVNGQATHELEEFFRSGQEARRRIVGP